MVRGLTITHENDGRYTLPVEAEYGVIHISNDVVLVTDSLVSYVFIKSVNQALVCSGIYGIQRWSLLCIKW